MEGSLLMMLQEVKIMAQVGKKVIPSDVVTLPRKAMSSSPRMDKC